jgi:hypothetical protein
MTRAEGEALLRSEFPKVAAAYLEGVDDFEDADRYYAQFTPETLRADVQMYLDIVHANEPTPPTEPDGV